MQLTFSIIHRIKRFSVRRSCFGIIEESRNYTTAKDKIHDAVKNALIKDGWKITADPYTMMFEGERISIDLAAETPIEAEREGNKILVEIKSFRGETLIYEFHEAIGQHLDYCTAIEEISPERTVYLAFDEDALKEIRQRRGLQKFLRTGQVRCFAVNLDREEIIEWIENWIIAS